MGLTPLGFIDLRDAISKFGSQFVDNWQGDEPSRWRQSDGSTSYSDFYEARDTFQAIFASEIKDKVWEYDLPFGDQEAKLRQAESHCIESIWTLLIHKCPELDFAAPTNVREGQVGPLNTWPLSSADVAALMTIPERFKPNWLLEECLCAYRLLTAWNTFRQKAEAGKVRCIMIVNGDRKDIRPGYWATQFCEYPDQLDQVNAGDAWSRENGQRALYDDLDQIWVPAYVNIEDLEEEPLALDRIVAQFIDHAGGINEAIMLATFAVVGAATKLDMQGGNEKVLPLVSSLLNASQFGPKRTHLRDIIGESLPPTWKQSGNPHRTWDDALIRAELNIQNKTNTLS